MMKNKCLLLFSLIILFFGYSCGDQVNPGFSYEPYGFSKVDDKGGSWKMILLERPEQINLPAPKKKDSPELKAALDEVVNNFNKEPEAIKYWGNNPILKWNEIARELGAKYNMPPAPNEQGIYILPSPSNPGSYPFFPFAHPPYMSRVFAYLSIAQYDALVVAWHYKYKYNQPALHQLDSRIKTVFEANNIPSYPSDGAVVTAVSQGLLSTFFPLEVEYIKQKADEMKRCLIASGISSKEDIAAGEFIGNEVVKIFRQRSANDGMSRAQAPLAVSDSLARIAFNNFGWAWKNQEIPQRPVGIAPLFGNVKPWFLPDVTMTRPGVPPSIGSEQYNRAAKELIDIQKNLTVQQRKIANFWSDGPGTYTPPGHWNRIACNEIIKNKLNPLRSARVLAYMNAAIQDGGISCWDTKYYYNYPRPINTIRNFKTILGTPNFPGYTSGHSTFSSAAATVLSSIFPESKQKFEAFAEEASVSRIYGGIHFRFDCTVGITQGRNVAQFVVAAAAKDGSN